MSRPSQRPAILLGSPRSLAGLQLWILYRQTGLQREQADAMNRQTTLVEKQNALAESQTTLQREQADAMSRQTALLDKQTRCSIGSRVAARRGIGRLPPSPTS